MSAGVTDGQAQLPPQKVLEGLEVRQTWRRNLEIYRTPKCKAIPRGSPFRDSGPKLNDAHHVECYDLPALNLRLQYESPCIRIRAVSQTLFTAYCQSQNRVLKNQSIHESDRNELLTGNSEVKRRRHCSGKEAMRKCVRGSKSPA
jgi:hypothetical protein